MSIENTNNNSSEPKKNTVGEVGGQVDKALGEEEQENSLLSNMDLKGKKIDADLEQEKDKPAEQ